METVITLLLLMPYTSLFIGGEALFDDTEIKAQIIQTYEQREPIGSELYAAVFDRIKNHTGIAITVKSQLQISHDKLQENMFKVDLVLDTYDYLININNLSSENQAHYLELKKRAFLLKESAENLQQARLDFINNN